jgi:outer membrane lipoprotein LolB
MRLLRGVRALVVSAACVFVGACAPLTPRTSDGAARIAAAQQAFDVSGRLSARHGSDAFAASFRWRHDIGRDELEFSSPLGQIVARLSGSPGAVALKTADGRNLSAEDWGALTVRGLGWPLPVDGLIYWIQGVPRQGDTSDVERDADGLPSVIRQDGWTIAYQAFSSADGVARPARMTLSYPDVELRVVIDSWR